ncbi:MAG: hypothetical protein SGARI_003994 [Bacillariaceae sp.]
MKFTFHALAITALMTINGSVRGSKRRQLQPDAKDEGILLQQVESDASEFEGTSKDDSFDGSAVDPLPSDAPSLNPDFLPSDAPSQKPTDASPSPKVITRTPITRNVEGLAGGGTGIGQFDFGGFDNPPAMSKFLWQLDGGGDINMDVLSVRSGLTTGRVQFNDRNKDDPFFFSFTGVELPSSTEYVQFKQRGATGCFTSPNQPEVPGKIPILHSFVLDYQRTNFDRNVKQMAVQVDTARGTNAPVVKACHADFNDDDVFDATVMYALVDEEFVVRFDNFENTKFGGGLDSSKVFDRPPNTVAVITGFDFEFLSGDRDLAKVLLELNQDGRIYVDYKSQSLNDYRWSVQIAYIAA